MSWVDNSGNESGFEIERETPHKKNDRWVDNTLLSVGADTTKYIDDVGDGIHRYRVRAVNDIGASDWTEWGTVTLTGGGDGGGKEKPCRGKKCP